MTNETTNTARKGFMALAVAVAVVALAVVLGTAVGCAPKQAGEGEEMCIRDSCGKTYRLYQEMHRIVAEGYPQDSILYFNFEDERLKPYEKELLQEVIEVFYARNPRARQEGRCV